MSNFPGALPQMPLWTFIVVPLIFVFIIVFTEFRYNLRPDNYIGHSTTLASLVIGFIFLYTMQKYDLMDLNVPIVVRSLTYLKSVALQYNQPQLVCYLISYAQSFLDFNGGDFSIFMFENKLAPHITDEETLLAVREESKKLEEIFNQRISGTNLIAQPIWYLVFIIALLLTLIFPLDNYFQKKVDAVVVLVLIWLPITTMYALYTIELQSLDTKINGVIDYLKQGIKCPNTKNKSWDNKGVSRIFHRR